MCGATSQRVDDACHCVACPPAREASGGAAPPVAAAPGPPTAAPLSLSPFPPCAPPLPHPPARASCPSRPTLMRVMRGGCGRSLRVQLPQRRVPSSMAGLKGGSTVPARGGSRAQARALRGLTARRPWRLAGLVNALRQGLLARGARGAAPLHARGSALPCHSSTCPLPQGWRSPCNPGAPPSAASAQVRRCRGAGAPEAARRRSGARRCSLARRAAACFVRRRARG